MTVDKSWRIDFEPSQIERIEGDSFKRILSNASGREDWAAAVDAARDLVEPIAAWDALPVREISHNKVVLEGGACLRGETLAGVVAGASEILVGVCTIGEGLSRRVQELQAQRRTLRALLLDDLGSWAVDSVRQQFCVRMAEQAALAGQHISTCLSPGESHWGLEDQRIIFSLIDAASVGVCLSATLIMSPRKSLSFAMGRGSQALGREGGSNCDLCTMKDRCAHRSRRAAVVAKESS